MISSRKSLVVCLILIISIITVRIIEKPSRVLTWDVFGYYLYLPATFIYDDPGLKDRQWLDDIMNKYRPSSTWYQLVDAPDGKRLIKYPAGVAVLMSPFFFIAHGAASISGYPADGVSLPYQYIMALGGILWAIAGIFIFRKVLLKFFNDDLTAILLVLVIAGTNYFHLASIDGTLLSHNFLFTLYALLLLFTIRWHETPSWTAAAMIGLSCGFITLIRPSEGVCFLIPLLWATGSMTALKSKLHLIRRNPLHIPVIILLSFCIGCIQFLYWKQVTGEWIVYSYSNNPGEGFRFWPPYIGEFLFSFRKGWLIYTPIMAFAVAGMFVMFRKCRENLPAILLFFLLDLWIISSWSCWWYGGGSFSSRSLVPAYVLLAIPLGYFLKTVFSTRLKIPIAIIVIFLVLLNLFQSWQFEKGIIEKDRMTRDYYCAVFGKTSIDKEKLDPLLLVDRTNEEFETPAHIERYTPKTIFDLSLPEDTSKCFKMNGDISFSPGPDMEFDSLTKKDHVWIKMTVELCLPEDYEGRMPWLICTFHYKGQAYKYRAFTFDGYEKGKWQTMTCWYLTPEVRTPEDNLKIYVWHASRSNAYLRKLKVEAFERNDAD